MGKCKHCDGLGGIVGRWTCEVCGGSGYATKTPGNRPETRNTADVPQPPPAPKPDDAVARARRLWQGIAWRDDLDAAGIIAAALRAERTRALEECAAIADSERSYADNPGIDMGEMLRRSGINWASEWIGRKIRALVLKEKP